MRNEKRLCGISSSGEGYQSLKEVKNEDSKTLKRNTYCTPSQASQPASQPAIPSHLLSLNRSNNLPTVLHLPKIQIPNPLPRPRIQPPLCNRHTHARPDQCTLDMRRHIIQTLRTMPVQIPLAILRRDPIECVAHVLPDFFVPVLVQREGAGCVLDEEVEDADFVVAELGEFAGDGVGDQVGAPGALGEGEGLLEPGHCGKRGGGGGVDAGVG